MSLHTFRVIEQPSFGLSHGQQAFRMFWRAFFYCLLQAAGVVLIARHSWWALATGFAIPYYWVLNVRGSVDYRVPMVRFCYGLGGMAGTGTALLAAWWLTN